MRPRTAGTPATSSALHPRADLRHLLQRLDALGVAATPRAIAAALWTHCDAHGRCWPSQLTLARLTGRCERTIRTAVQALAAAGVLARDVPTLRDRKRHRRTTAYRFTVGSWRPIAAPPPPSPPEARAPVLQLPPPPQPPDAERPAPEPSTAAVDDASSRTSRDAPGVDPQQQEEALVDAAGPSVRFVGWTLVELEGEALASPATDVAPSPATTAGRRPQREKTPPTPTRPPPARCDVAPAPELPEALARSIERVRALVVARAATG